MYNVAVQNMVYGEWYSHEITFANMETRSYYK